MDSSSAYGASSSAPDRSSSSTSLPIRAASIAAVLDAALGARPRSGGGGLLAAFDARLPFELTGGQRAVNRDLEAKARAIAGLKAYITNMTDPTPQFVIGAYHQLWHIEKSFRMSKHDLRARPIYHHKRESSRPT